MKGIAMRRKTSDGRSVAMEFSPAVDLVLAALERMREAGGKLPRASRTSLAQLHQRAQAGPAVALVRPAPTAAATSDKIGRLAALQARVAPCIKCPHLARSRTQTVFGVGNPDAELMFVGEAPGADEDAQGEPFVGRAGQLLTRIITTMGFSRDDVYIANVLKCRPDMPPGSPGNRPPTPEEMQTCLPYLAEQIEIIQPKVMVALGATAVEGLLGTRGPMHAMRGHWHEHHETPLMITYHPSYLLRNQAPTEKRKVWEDMLMVLERLERPISEKQRKFFT
jgi:uracil-DNA glycosylase family 4